MAGTLAFSKFVVKDIFRNKGRTFSSIIGVVLAVSLIAGENIALDTTARDVLAQELKDYDYDFEGVTDTLFDFNDFASISPEIESIKGVKKAIALGQVNENLEIHNESTITPPKFGYYERTIEVDIPVNGTIWLNTTLEQIPNDTYKLFGYVYSQITGEPVANALLEVYEGSVSSNGYYNETNTDENGYYEFYLPEAKYIIEVAADPSIQTSDIIEINSSIPEKQLDFHIQDFENSKIKGYLLDPVTGEPFNRTARVEIWNSSTGYSNYSWIYDGYFDIDVIFGNLTIIGWEYWDDMITNFTEIEIKKNATTWQNLTLNPPLIEDVVIRGHVYNKETGEPVRSNLRIERLENPYYSNRILTDQTGYFELDSTSGNLSLTVVGNPQARDITYERYEIELNATSGQTIERDIYLTPINSRIRGDAFTTEGDVIDSARLNVDGSSIRKTYHDGYYGWDVSAGTHNISFDASPSEVPIYHSSNYTSVFGMIPDSKTIHFLEETYQYKIIEGSFELGDDKTVISEDIANRYNLKVGGTINILLRNSYMDVINDTYVNDYSILNYTISGIIMWEDPEFPGFFKSFGSHAIFLEYTDFESFYSSIAEIRDPPQVTTNVLIRIDRDKIIDPLNQDTTDFAITRLLTKVHTVSLIKYDMRVDYLIEVALSSYFSWYNSYRIQILAYALPVVAVGFYMGMVGIELAMAQKRRPLGIIKSRGASDKQIFTSLILESVILGIIAGTVGLILGVFVSRIFLTIIPGSRNIPTELDFFKLNISAGSIFWAVVFAVLLMLFASIKPAKRISKTPVIESLHQHTDVGSKKEYKPAIDIFLVSFAIFAFIIVSEVNIGNLNPAELGQLFTILIVIIYLISVIWLPFSPFFLMFSLTRLLTRGTNRVYKFFSKMVRPFAKDLWYIIHKNLTRNPKKVSMISIIIALALGFGIFMTTMIATTMNGEELKAKAQIGGDLNVRTFRANLSFGENLEEIEGVEDVVALNHMYGDMISGGDFESRKIAIFNATKYGESIDVDEYYFVEGSKKGALKALSQGNSVIIGENIAQFYSIKVGDIIRIDNPYISESGAQSGHKEVTFNTNNFKVAGVVRALPGLEDPFDDDFASWGGLVYLDFAALTTDISDVEAGWIYLITVENGVDSVAVENEIDENYASNTGRIENLDTEISDIRNDMPTRSILFIMLVDIGFMIIIITVGLGLIMFISISERKNEFATIMARGAEVKQMLVIILGEALSITMVGVVVGISSGLFTAYTFNKMISTNNLFGASGGTLSGRPLIIPWYGILVVLLALVALFATSFVAAYRVKRIKLHSALRIRGG